jgi:hypothetical protein
MPADRTEPWVVTVASTTDLQTWTTESFEIAAPDGLSEDVQLWVAPDRRRRERRALGGPHPRRCLDPVPDVRRPDTTHGAVVGIVG